MNIYEKMAAIMDSVQYLAKDDRVEYGQTRYKALSEEKVTSIMRKQFVANKLLVYPVEMTSSRAGQISHVDVKYRIVNAEAPDEFIEVVSCGDGADSQDKGAGKAMTYAFKYMWLRTFAIPTGEDPDKVSSDELDDLQRKAEEKRKAMTAVCEDCGAALAPVRVRDGSIWDVATQVRYTKGTPEKPGRFGRILCPSCQKQALKAEQHGA